MRSKSKCSLALILILVILLTSIVLNRIFCFELIQPGMTYYQVVLIMGAKGERMETSVPLYCWHLDNGSRLQVQVKYQETGIEFIDNILPLSAKLIIQDVGIIKPNDLAD